MVKFSVYEEQTMETAVYTETASNPTQKDCGPVFLTQVISGESELYEFTCNPLK